MNVRGTPFLVEEAVESDPKYVRTPARSACGAGGGWGGLTGPRASVSGGFVALFGVRQPGTGFYRLPHVSTDDRRDSVAPGLSFCRFPAQFACRRSLVVLAPSGLQSVPHIVPPQLLGECHLSTDPTLERLGRRTSGPPAVGVPRGWSYPARGLPSRASPGHRSGMTHEGDPSAYPDAPRTPRVSSAGGIEMPCRSRSTLRRSCRLRRGRTRG